MSRVRRQVRVSGVVQGVGFRPFVYRLAAEEHLTGNISNGTAGVSIEIEGSFTAIESFLRRLPLEQPPLAHIESVEVLEMPVQGDEDFRITRSDASGRVVTSIPADAATCDDCLRELLDPRDRRYRYPFTNCTNCGPRFTITRSIPYDRPQTSMAKFAMCAACQAEYDDPLNRRFHAQPNACWDCGPRLWLTNAAGEMMETDDPVAATVVRLAAGEIVALKGIGGFHLAVDATNEEAVQRLRRRKHRYGKPLAVMLPNLESVKRYCHCDDNENRLLTSVERSIVLLRKRDASQLKAEQQIAASVAPNLPWLGVFLPYAPLHHLLFAQSGISALVMTSANLSEEPIAIDNDEALDRLKGIADSFLFHDREILQRCDDSVMAVVEGQPQIIRRARGFVPLPIPLPMETAPLLAVGGHLKNVFCLASGHSVYQSQHLGDLENLTSLDFFRESLIHLKRTFDIEPQVIVHDMHPGYLSTQWAMEQEKPLIAVQHHHAHIAGCMAEHRLTGPVIGLSLDGTGYGTDGNIWGGEVLIATLPEFERFAHLKYVAMPGSAAAIREPWRMAFSHLLAAAGDAARSAKMLSLLGTDESSARVMARMIERKINSPLTSSCGRIFDAAAALIMGRRTVDYEAQAAIELEGLALREHPDAVTAGYPIDLLKGNWTAGSRTPWRLDPTPLWRALLEDLRAGISAAQMSLRFHAGVANAYTKAAVAAREVTGIREVCCGGGVFHNALLNRLLIERLREAGFEVFLQSLVSPGDGGLSYGQAAVAAARLAAQTATAAE